MKDSMLSQLSKVAERHWVVGGIFASLLWVIAGRQYLQQRQPGSAIAWQCIGAIILLILCGWTIKEKEWIGLVFAIIVLVVELRSISSAYAVVAGGDSHWSITR